MIAELEPTLRRTCGPLSGEVYRYAEDQERSVTRSLVSTHEEHDILEAILEASKPPLPPSKNLPHYLLATPFRYPPLPYGSRFGSRTQRGILYASESFAALQAELAFYRFRFFYDMEQPPAQLTSRHLLFAFDYRAVLGVDLTQVREPELQHQFRSPRDYHLTQQLGDWARAQALDAIRYYSARLRDSECNLALLHPETLRSDPRPQFNFTATVTAESLSITTGAMAPREFDTDIPLASFLVEGELPRPAS